MWRLLTDLIDKARPAVEASNCGEVETVERWRGGDRPKELRDADKMETGNETFLIPYFRINLN